MKFLKYAPGHFKVNQDMSQMSSQDHLEFWSQIHSLQRARSFSVGFGFFCFGFCFVLLSLSPGSDNVLHFKSARCRPMLEILSPRTCSTSTRSVFHLQRLLVYAGYKKQWKMTLAIIIAHFKMHFASLESLQPSVIHLMLSKTGFRQNIINLTLLIHV